MPNQKPIDNCYWVVPGLFLAGEYPRNHGDLTSSDKVAALTDFGVNAFVDLTEEGELAPYTQWLDPESHTHERFPIRDAGTPASPGFTTSILDAIDGHIGEGRLVYLHCHGGHWPHRNHCWLLVGQARKVGTECPGTIIEAVGGLPQVSVDSFAGDRRPVPVRHKLDGRTGQLIRGLRCPKWSDKPGIRGMDSMNCCLVG